MSFRQSLSLQLLLVIFMPRWQKEMESSVLEAVDNGKSTCFGIFDWGCYRNPGEIRRLP
jgi:hypothetical protein